MRENSKNEEMDFKKAGDKIRIDYVEVETMTHDKILKKFDIIAKNIAEQQRMSFYKEFERVTKKTGNITDLKGKGLTPDSFFDTLKKIWIDFDENGNPILPTFTGNEKAIIKIKEVLKQIDNDPKLSEKNKQLIIRKKEEWRDRESNRKLVGLYK